MQAPFHLSQADGQPMYLQIMEHIKRLVISGQWPPGHSLPSIRELAVSLTVSVITVKRAYQELEREGVILTRHGKGSFVAESTTPATEQKMSELDQQLQDAIMLARLLNITDKVLLARLTALLENSDNIRDSDQNT